MVALLLDNAGTSSRLIHGAARRNWLSGPPHSEARTGLVDAPVRGHSCPASCPYSIGLRDRDRGRVSSLSDRRPHPLLASHRRGGSRAHLPALVVGPSAVAHGSCFVGRGRGLRDRPQPAELAVPRGCVPGRYRLLLGDVGFVEGSCSGGSRVRGCGSGACVGSGAGGAVGARSLRPLGLPLARGRVGETLNKVRGWNPKARETDGASSPGACMFSPSRAGSQRVSQPVVLGGEAGFHPRTASVAA